MSPGKSHATLDTSLSAAHVLHGSMCFRYLTEKEAIAAVGYAHRPYAIAAWRFLTKTGYINFGVAPPMAAKQSSRAEPPTGTVIVIGAGMAGTLFHWFTQEECNKSCMLIK